MQASSPGTVRTHAGYVLCIRSDGRRGGRSHAADKRANDADGDKPREAVRTVSEEVVSRKETTVPKP
ncbi:hypothetical protein EVAR_21985_1 [Eumeta japonica]|uniref:Uncharacterized protein n=1 Tax=Eumeta variegata TaxID=151549 RepID=A0A4C1VWW4_EUMVA|nr:hypothetical protein EVAR_21985_1 [Eumeta japonica]